MFMKKDIICITTLLVGHMVSPTLRTPRRSMVLSRQAHLHVSVFAVVSSNRCASPRCSFSFCELCSPSYLWPDRVSNLPFRRECLKGEFFVVLLIDGHRGSRNSLTFLDPRCGTCIPSPTLFRPPSRVPSPFLPQKTSLDSRS